MLLQAVRSHFAVCVLLRTTHARWRSRSPSTSATAWWSTSAAHGRGPTLVAVAEGTSAERSWTFLTNHAHVLVVVRSRPEALLREIADAVGITSRAVQLILGDLEAGGYLRRSRVGRRNEYAVLGGPLRHPLEHGHAVDDLLDALDATPPPSA